MSNQTPASKTAWPLGDGEMVRRIREHNWAATPLGAIADWPQSLKCTLELALNMRHPAAIAWGTEVRLLYNDEYIAILGDRHPGALGQPFQQVWPEVGHVFKPHIDAVLAGQPQLWGETPFDVTGLSENLSRRWFTASWTPIGMDAGEVGGFFNVSTETTALRTSEKWQAGQKDAFQAAIDGAPLNVSLGHLSRLAVEQADAGSWCGFYLANQERGILNHVVGMSDAFAQCVDGVPIGPDEPGCGLAVHTGRPVITFDVLENPSWKPWLWLPQRFGFRGVWSFPVETAGNVLGTFALYFPAPREPTPRDYEFAAVISRAAAIIILRTQEAEKRAKAEVALRESESKLAIELADTQQLQRVSSSLIKNDDIHALYGQILDAARSLMRAQFASVQTLAPERNELFLLAHKGFAPESAKFWEWVRLDHSSSCAVALERGEPVTVPDVEQCDFLAGSEDLASYRRSKIRAVLSTPLISRGGRLVGMISTHWREVHQPSERELRLLDVLARQVADLIERRTAEAALRESEERYRAIAANLPSGAAFVVDRDLRYQLAGGEALKDAGFTPADFEGKTLREALPSHLAAQYEPYYRGALAGRSFQVEHEAHGRTFVTHGVPLDGNGGPIEAVLAVSYDITERRRAEAALAQSEERLRLALLAARMGIWTLDVSADVQMRDANLNRLLGLEAVETTQPFDEFFSHIHPDDRGHVRAAFDEAIGKRQPLGTEFRVVWPDGTVRWLRDQGDVFGTAGATTSQLAGACVDITERREAEDALRESEGRFRLLVENVRDYAIMTTDAGGRVTTWNPGAQRIFGYSHDEITGKEVKVLFTPEDREARVSEKELFEAARDGRASDDRWQMRKDGSRFWASGVTSAMRDASGRLRGFIKVLRDQTDTKLLDEQRERLLAQEQAALYEARAAMVMKDEFIAVVSHELRTPLTAILIWAKLLRGGGVSPEEVPSALEAIESSAMTQRRLIEDLLDASRMLSGKLHLNVQDVELAPIVQSAVLAVRPMAEAKGVDVAYASDAPVVKARVDPDRIQQVVWNLVNNAVKFSETGGRVSVSVGRPNGTVEIRVADMGRGIASEFLPHVFERFRQADASTTRTHGGLGLGLAISRQIVELHGGTIHAQSEGLGRGATLTVTLPLHDVQLTTSPRPASSADPGKLFIPTPVLAGVRILVVDDEGYTQAAVRWLFEQCGAQVTAASSADEAAEAFRAAIAPDGAGLDVLVCDIGMPGRDGYDLIQEIRAIEREQNRTFIPAVALTAYARDENRKRARDAGFQSHVSKPVDPRTLVNAVVEVSGKALRQLAPSS